MDGKILTRRNLIRLAITGVIILGGIYLGSEYYINILEKSADERVQLKDFTETINKATSVNFELILDNEKIIIDKTELQNWKELYVREYSQKETLRISDEKVSEYVRTLAVLKDIEPVNAKFEVKNGKVAEFKQSVVGKKINISLASTLIRKALIKGESSAVISFQLTEPEISLEKINNLGITSLIGKGESSFTGSSAARVHNIRVGMSRFNGLLIKPGEEFSFNNYLGEVEESTGFRYELVIKNGKVATEVGGGICQVSTTMFRAAIMSGLPILERKPHSFPVKYYNPQGFDSTIYPGITDLKFKNDTPNNILVQGKVEGTKLTFEIYGSDDGRKVKVEGPYQYDIRPSGAMKAYFTRKIYYDDELKNEEKFTSVYKAPPAQEKNPLE
jgi:vancomycin resistance protein YoaR